MLDEDEEDHKIKRLLYRQEEKYDIADIVKVFVDLPSESVGNNVQLEVLECHRNSWRNQSTGCYRASRDIFVEKVGLYRIWEQVGNVPEEFRVRSVDFFCDVGEVSCVEDLCDQSYRVAHYFSAFLLVKVGEVYFQSVQR